MAVRHVFCMNEKLTKRRPFQVLGAEKAMCVWKVLMAFAIVCKVFSRMFQEFVSHVRV